MKSERQGTLKCLCDILLLLTINVGIVGALLEILEISWNVAPWNVDSRNALSGSSLPEGSASVGNVIQAGMPGAGTLYGGAFWGGLFFFCALAVFLRGIGDRRRKIRWMGVCVSVYISLAALFRDELSAGLSLALHNAAENLNRRYSFHIVLPGAALLQEMERAGRNPVWFATFGILFALIPFELLTAFLRWRGRCIYLVAGNALWLAAACTCNIFPEYFFLVFCVLGLVAVLVQENFETMPAAGLGAVSLVLILAGLVMGGIRIFLMPSLDEHYEAISVQREDFYETVNGKWIPQIESLFPEWRFGFGPGSDVTGNLNRQNIFAYTSSDVYRVTVSRIPQGALYLKGFVGGIYGESAWEAQSDQDFENYYQRNGLRLPRSYGDLQNIGYEAAGAVREGRKELFTEEQGQISGEDRGQISVGDQEQIFGEDREYISIEELGDRSSYSVYPYGARLTEDFQIHADGSVAWKSREYQFQYRYISETDGASVLSGEWRTLEEQYRQYVYDNFLEYSPEELPLFTKRLEQADIRSDSPYKCALDIMNFLDGQAVYDLDVGRNPSGTDFVEYFLFESHRGYCVHFASAAVLAFRYFGIPARYVTGYTVSSSAFSPDENGAYTAVLTGKQAHAWAEIYLDGIGWAPVEMTPGAVAFSGDSRMEQLTQLGRMTGEESPVPWGHSAGEERTDSGNFGLQGPETGLTRPKSAGKEENPGHGPESASESVEEPGKHDVGAKSQGQNAEEGSRDPGTPEEKEALAPDFMKPAVGMQGEFDGNRTGDAEGPGGFFPGRPGGFKIVSIAVSAALATAVALWALWEMVCRRRRRLWRRALQTADVGECIFLLYQNLRKALRMAGCPRRLAVDGEAFWHVLQEICPRLTREEYEVFCGILEKNSFGNVEPTAEELEKVRSMHDRLVGEAGRRVLFYRKMLFVTEGENREC